MNADARRLGETRQGRAFRVAYETGYGSLEDALAIEAGKAGSGNCVHPPLLLCEVALRYVARAVAVASLSSLRSRSGCYGGVGLRRTDRRFQWIGPESSSRERRRRNDDDLHQIDQVKGGSFEVVYTGEVIDGE